MEMTKGESMPKAKHINIKQWQYYESSANNRIIAQTHTIKLPEYNSAESECKQRQRLRMARNGPVIFASWLKDKDT